MLQISSRWRPWPTDCCCILEPVAVEERSCKWETAAVHHCRKIQSVNYKRSVFSVFTSIHQSFPPQVYYLTFVGRLFSWFPDIIFSRLWPTSCTNVQIKLPRANRFSCAAGRQEPWCGDARCQQGEHSEPACGRSVRGSGTALHGSVHSHPGGRSTGLAAGAGGAFQGSARGCRYRTPSPRQPVTPPLYLPSLSPELLFRPEGLWFSHPGGHPSGPNHTSRLLPCCNFTLDSAGSEGWLSQPCCKFVVRSAAQT